MQGHEEGREQACKLACVAAPEPVERLAGDPARLGLDPLHTRVGIVAVRMGGYVARRA